MPSAPSTHAVRHPLVRMQLSRRRLTKSSAVRASDNLRLEQSRKRRVDFQEAIDEEFERRAALIAEIAQRYHKKPNFVRGILCSISQYKTTRAPTLRNAVVHERAKDYRAEGNPQKLEIIRAELQADIDNGVFSLDTITDEETKRLIDQLLEHRQLKRKGARATNKAAEVDAKKTIGRIADAMEDLEVRTGVCGVAFFSRGNADDPALPHIIDSGQATDFLAQVLQIDAADVLRKFEQWLCTREEGKHEKNGVNDVRKDVSRYLQDGLRKITNNPNTTMDYVNFDVAVREAKGVELAGFPADVKIEKRADWNVETGRRIREMLKTGAIHWVKMTKAQHEAFVAEQNAKRAALGAGSLRKRKERSDKGQKRGKHTKAAATGDADDSDDGREDEVVRPTPRGTTTSLAPGVGSAVVNAAALRTSPDARRRRSSGPQHRTSSCPRRTFASPPGVRRRRSSRAQRHTSSCARSSVPGTAAPPLVPDAPLPNPNDATAAPLFPYDAGADTSLTVQLDPELLQLMEEMEAYMPPIATNLDLTRATPAPSTPPFPTLPAPNSPSPEPLSALSTNIAPIAGSKRKHGEGISADLRAAIGNSGAVPRKRPRQQGAGTLRGGENAAPPVPKPRKKRSDAGVPRGSKKSAAPSA
ncbi:hypothetical protein B0H12DRAFT_1232759 [Mycena haematopus]|nr:hypothetical protein B0H12DRAFT_1232759 [Mycena haematopus]